MTGSQSAGIAGSRGGHRCRSGSAARDLRRAAGLGVRRALRADAAGQRRIVISLDAGTDAQVQAVAEGALFAADGFRKLTHRPAPPAIESIGIVGLVTVVPAGSGDRTRHCPGRVHGPRLDESARQSAGTERSGRAGARLPEGHPGRDRGPRRTSLGEGRLWRDPGGGRRLGQTAATAPSGLRPRGANRHLVLIGKGITYDSGGYNLKPAESLKTMKCDMAGAASVIVATRAIADLGLSVRVTAYAPLAESMISGSAYRPGDVLTIFDGTTVENIDSDCEGRIVLADALARANADQAGHGRRYRDANRCLVVALGTRVAGLMASDDAAADRLLDAAETAGEEFWQLPITEHVRSHRSPRWPIFGRKPTGMAAHCSRGHFCSISWPIRPAGLIWMSPDRHGTVIRRTTTYPRRRPAWACGR